MGADVVDLEDVRMVQDARGARFLLEAAEAVAVVGESRRQDLDRDVAGEPRVAGAVDLAHAS